MGVHQRWDSRVTDLCSTPMTVLQFEDSFFYGGKYRFKKHCHAPFNRFLALTQTLPLLLDGLNLFGQLGLQRLTLLFDLHRLGQRA